MAFDRKAFQGTKVSTMKEQQKKVDTTIKRGNSQRADYLEITEGKNKLRIYPAHPGTKTGFFCFPRTIHWLDVETQYEKDGKTVVEVKRKPIFNSRVHGDTTKDIIDEYIGLAHKIAYEDIQDEEERKKFLKAIVDFKDGIKAQTRWIVYGEKIEGKSSAFGRIDLPTTVKDKMNEISNTTDDSEDVIQTDPFTDPDDGRCLLVEYDKQEALPKNKRDPKNYYKATLLWEKPVPISDEKLAKFMEQTPLEKIFHKSYRRKDFEMALDGLRRFDSVVRKELGNEAYNFFEREDFQDTVEEISQYYPESDENEIDEMFDKEKRDSKKAKLKDGKKATTKPEVITKKGVLDKQKDRDSKKVTPKEDQDGQMPWDKDLEDMDRVELKGIIRREDLPIKVTSKDTEEDIRDMIRKEQAILKAKTKAKDKAKKQEEEEEELPASRRRSGSSSRLSKLKEEEE